MFGLIQTLLYISYPRDETTGEEDDNEQFLREDGDSAAGGSETEII